jgi:hypothetical protein
MAHATEADLVVRARLRGKRIGLGVVIAVAVSFIGASAVQIIPVVFGADETALAAAAPASPERACALGLHGLLLALDRAGARGLSRTRSRVDADSALTTFRQALSPEWDDVEAVAQQCASSHDGLDAWAAVERLRIGEEQAVRRSRLELTPLRDDVVAHLPADLR